MGPVAIAARRTRAWRAFAVVAGVCAAAAIGGVHRVAREPRCVRRGFVPAPRAPERRACEQLEQGCWLGDHPGYFELEQWLAPHALGFQLRSNAADLDGDGRVDCFTATLTRAGWIVEARRGRVSCVDGPVFHPSAPFVMSRHLHAAAGPTALVTAPTPRQTPATDR